MTARIGILLDVPVADGGRGTERVVRFAIDDTGAGYASLNHVLQLRPDVIKLDRGLITGVESDPARRALVTALVLLALELGATVTGEGIETLVATMSVGYKAIKESFTTRVTLDHPRLKITVEYVDGPFKYLENRWTFREVPGGCDVEFYINYEFKSFALGLALQPLAGVAVVLAEDVRLLYPAFGEGLMNIVLVMMVVLGAPGAIATQWALIRSREQRPGGAA